MFEQPSFSSTRIGGLGDFARLVGNQDGESLEQAQDRLEERLRPIVRLALRKGEGIPEVVGWVKRAQANLGVDPVVRFDQCAVEIARMLSATLLRASARRTANASHRHADTVVGF
jgi:hypothetical protein